MSQTHNAMPVLPCFCASLRRASRTVTQHYDAALRRHGLRATQFNILQVLARAGELSQGRLGGILSMDSTTLTRTLEIMARRGWIAQRAGADRRERHLSLSAMGRRRMRRATPAWEKAQSRLRVALGEKLWGDFQSWSDQVTLTVTKGE